MKNKRDRILFWIPLILTIILSLLQLVPPPSDDLQKRYNNYINYVDSCEELNVISAEEIVFKPIESIHVFVWNKRFLISISISIFSVILLLYYYFSENTQKRWLQTYLQMTTDQLFAGKNVRLSIFLTTDWRIVYLVYLYKLVFTCRREHFEKGITKIVWKQRPKKGGQMLRLYVRANEPYQDGTSTFFEIPHKQHSSAGVVGRCAFSKSTEIVDVKPISKFYKEGVLCYHTNQAVYNEYLSKTYITQDKLSCMHSQPNHIYATPIMDTHNKTVLGVLTADVDTDDDTKFFDQSSVDRLGEVARVIANIINNNF